MLKTKTKIIIGVMGIISLFSAVTSCLLMRGTSAANCTTSPCNTTFQVDVKETLTVSITVPTSYDEGYANELLTGQVDVSVTSNNASGFVAGVRASNAAATLTSSSGGTLNNLASSTTGSNFPTGRWGYSLSSGAATSKTYNALPAYNGTPATLFSNSSAGSKSGSVYFAAKAGYDNPSGTYEGTVNISVVSGRTSFDPVTPTPDPVGPDAPGSTPTYHTTENVTTYTTRTQSGDNETTTTEVSSGDNTSVHPLGETERTDSSIKTNSSPLPVILAITSATSAAIGLGFFIIAKRREEEDDEDLE